MKKNIIKLIALVIVCSFTTGPFHITAKSRKSIIREGQKNKNQIIATGEKLKQEIRNKFNKFLNTIKKIDRNADFALPVEARNATNLITHNNQPGKKRIKRVYAYVSADFALRSDASMASTRIGVMVRKGKRLEVIFLINKRDASNDFKWCLVRTTRNYEGFIPNTFLTNSKKSKTQIKKFFFVNASSGLNLREEPAAGGRRIINIPDREKVTVLKYTRKAEKIGSKRGKWARVQYKKYTGWVFAPYLIEKKVKVTKGFFMPVSGRISSKFGNRIDPITRKPKSYHRGIDIVCRRNTPIKSAADGKISRTKWSSGYGKLTIIEHAGGFFTYYAHQSKFKKRQGARVRKGEVIGLVGTTGRSTGPHLHFEVRKGKTAVNPNTFLPN